MALQGQIRSQAMAAQNVAGPGKVGPAIGFRRESETGSRGLRCQHVGHAAGAA